MGLVEAQIRYGLKEALYVKHDVYRFMFTSVLFFGMCALAQLSSGNFKMLVTFGLCLKFLISALRTYNDSNFTWALNNLAICGIIIAGCELLFLKVPFDLGG
jgi:hypothetical protein